MKNTLKIYGLGHTHTPAFPTNNVCNLPVFCLDSFPTVACLSAMQTASPGDSCYSGRHGAEDRTGGLSHPSQCQVVSPLSFWSFFKLPIISFSRFLRYLVPHPHLYQVVVLPLSPTYLLADWTCWPMAVPLHQLSWGSRLSSPSWLPGQTAVY